MENKQDRISSFIHKIVIQNIFDPMKCDKIRWGNAVFYVYLTKLFRNAIKIRCSNTVFYVYWRKISRNWDHFSSTAIILDTLCKILLSTTSHYYALSCDQKSGITILLVKSPKSSSSNGECKIICGLYKPVNNNIKIFYNI